MRRLILFDIDGTLTRTTNGYLPFNEAIFATFGLHGDIRTVVPDGNTDPRIVEDIFKQMNAPFAARADQWCQFEASKPFQCAHPASFRILGLEAD